MNPVSEVESDVKYWMYPTVEGLHRFFDQHFWGDYRVALRDPDVLVFDNCGRCAGTIDFSTLTVRFNNEEIHSCSN